MKRLVALAVAVAVLLPGMAFAGSSTDTALGLGAFAVFNQILSGTGIFARSAPVVVAQPAPPAVYAPPPPPVVVYQAPPPPPAVIYEPPPPPPTVVYQPYPVYRPYPVYEPYPVYYPAAPPHVVVVERPRWCPPGLARRGRC